MNMPGLRRIALENIYTHKPIIFFPLCSLCPLWLKAFDFGQFINFSAISSIRGVQMGWNLV
ncbi:MAG: hypothetical protein BMS9Abin25_0773 [Gammaproteobacteria bacterium]|nr:MAG: hypothetical protein BMS9Abin25_0773 [Gammaproteobacteria bacterium]